MMCRIMPNGQVPYWIGTHGDMISSDLHGDEETTRWMLRPHQGAEAGKSLIRGFAPKRRRRFHQRHFDRTRPRGNDPFSVEH